MRYEKLPGADLSALPQDGGLLRLRSAGRQIAKSVTIVRASRGACAALERRSKEAARAIKAIYKQNTLHGPDGRWLIDNYRLILTAQKETRQLAASFREYRGALTAARPTRSRCRISSQKAILAHRSISSLKRASPRSSRAFRKSKRSRWGSSGR
jgi:hypothetical protein